MAWSIWDLVKGKPLKSELKLVGAPHRAALFFLGDLSYSEAYTLGAVRGLGRDLGRFLDLEEKRSGFNPGAIIFHYPLSDDVFHFLDDGMRETGSNISGHSSRPLEYNPARTVNDVPGIVDRLDTGFNLLYVSNGFCSQPLVSRQIAEGLAERNYTVRSYTKIPSI